MGGAEEYGSSKKKKRKSYLLDYDGPNWTYKTEVCRNIAQTGYCKMGDWCVFAHDESELFAHRSGTLGPGLPYGRGHAVEEKGMKGMKKGYGKALAPMCGGKGKGPYGKGAMAKGGGFMPKGGYGKGGYGKGGGKRCGKQAEIVEEEENGEEEVEDPFAELEEMDE